MQKTMYIPRGQEMRLESLTCERIVVNGSLCVSGNIRTKHICGKGFVLADTIHAESVAADTVEANTVITDRLIARRVFAVEVRATQNMAVSSFLRAGYVKTEKLIVADAEIENLESDEVVKLSVKQRGLLGTLFVAFIRSKWTELFCRESENEDGYAVEEDDDYTDNESDDAEEGDDAEYEDVSPEIEESENLADDPEFLRLKAMYKLAQESGYIWQLIPKSERTDRAVTISDKFYAPDVNVA